MAKRAKYSKIKKHLTYTIQEAADTLSVSLATVRNWIKKGLPIQKEQRPFLIYGDELRAFILRTQKTRKYQLALDQLACFACAGPSKPKNGLVEYIPQTSKTGRLSGVCEACDGKCSRIVSNLKLSNFEQVFRIHYSGGEQPYTRPANLSKITTSQGAIDYDKT